MKTVNQNAMKDHKVRMQDNRKKISNSKMSLRTLIFNLKTQQPALINPWNSQQLSFIKLFNSLQEYLQKEKCTI
ncbi:hypothetical protein Avbf_04090 [Armadillidium vulgare]|nr:hypothetical protein Avbf_04090 [Armadillidium vulgare]